MEISAVKRKPCSSVAPQKQRAGQLVPAGLSFVIVAAFVIGFVLLGGGLLPTTEGGASVPLAQPAPKLILKEIDAQNMVLSPAQMAPLYDYVLLHTGKADAARQIKGLNPNVKVMLYRAPHMTWGWQEDWGTINSHESWFMHDPSGHRTRSTDPNDAWYLMDIRNSEFRAYQIQYISNLLNTYGFDGLFWDGPPGAVTGNLSLNPGPDPAAASTWHQDVLTFLKQFKQALGAKWLITNSTPTYDTGVAGMNDTDYLPYVDGTEIEGFGHAPWNSATEPPGGWDWQQRMAQRNLSAGKILLAIAGVQLPASSDQVHQWQLFTYGSALLWADGVHLYYSWSPWGTNQTGIIFPEMTVSLGSPLGATYSSGGVSQRDFTGGKVLVNGSDRARKIDLSSPFRLLTGTPVTTIVLQPWSGILLLK